MTACLTMEPQADLLAWAGERVGAEDGWTDDAVALGVIEHDTRRIRAVMVMNLRQADTAAIHFASDGSKAWMTRPVWRGLFAWLFDFCGLARVTATVERHNMEMQIRLLRLGFAFEGHLRGGARGGEDGIVFGMLRDECPWLDEEF